MTNDLSTVYGDIIAQAAETPRQTGETARVQKRLGGASDALLILADVSSSMDEMASSRTKYDLLREALGQARRTAPNARLVTFASWPLEIAPGQDLPLPSGSTALDAALEYAIPLRPRWTLVISDGQPNDPDAALAAVDRITGTVDVLYCGPDGDVKAIAFMRRLARLGGGRVTVHDVVKAAKGGRAELATLVQGLLPAPHS